MINLKELRRSYEYIDHHHYGPRDNKALEVIEALEEAKEIIENRLPKYRITGLKGEDILSPCMKWLERFEE